MLSFLSRWDYCWKCEFATDVKRENYYYHDGEQLGFYEKSTFARNKEFQFIWQKLYVFKWTSNAIFNMKKVDLDQP